MISRRRDGSAEETYDGEGKIIEFLYYTALGHCVLDVLVSPFVSRTAGWLLDSKISAFLIKPFVRKNKLDLNDYPVRSYVSFNDFFTRRIIQNRRAFCADDNVLCAPCDGKLTVLHIQENTHFSIKGCDYMLPDLLRSHKLSEQFRGGTAVLIRLTVDDYHRYCYPVSGKKGVNVHLQGIYHTVNPRAAAALPIYRENTREYTLIETEKFGTVLMMEIGAMMVGRINNLHDECKVCAGEEKGYFEFGGSSVLLLIEKARLLVDQDLEQNSSEGIETIVRQGEQIGIKQ